jgi:hypothetical protein
MELFSRIQGGQPAFAVHEGVEHLQLSAVQGVVDVCAAGRVDGTDV